MGKELEIKPVINWSMIDKNAPELKHRNSFEPSTPRRTPPNGKVGRIV
jgi:hypothetical protein